MGMRHVISIRKPVRYASAISSQRAASIPPPIPSPRLRETVIDCSSSSGGMHNLNVPLSVPVSSPFPGESR